MCISTFINGNKKHKILQKIMVNNFKFKQEHMVLKCQLVTDKTSNYEQNEAKVLIDGICDEKNGFL